MRIVVDIRKDANAQVILNQLYQYTQLQDTVGVIMLAIDHKVPKGAHPEADAAESTSSFRMRWCAAAPSTTRKRPRSAPTFWRA